MPSLLEIEKSMNNQIQRNVNKFASLLSAELGTDLENATTAQLNAIKKKLPGLLAKSGLSEMYDVILSYFGQVEVDTVRQLSKDTSISVEDLTEPSLNRQALINSLDIDQDVKNINKDLLRRVRKSITVFGVKNLTNKASINKFTKSLVARTKAQVETEAATSVMGYDRAVMTARANQAGLHRFKYMGPKDSRNRKFCRRRVGKIFTDKQADQWRNGQKEPASKYLGGYNCRHRKVYQV